MASQDKRRTGRETKRQMTKPDDTCPYCDGTGDVHRADGEWMGTCTACRWAEYSSEHLQQGQQQEQTR